MDIKKNNHGYKIIELCKNNNLVIANGRTGTDKHIGKMTFRNISVIDYLILTIPAYSTLRDFNIKETDNIYSDGHALIECTLNITTPKKPKQTKSTINDKPKWVETKSSEFTQNISDDQLKQLLQSINTTKLSINSENKCKDNQAANNTKIDMLTTEIEKNIYYKCRKNI